MDESEKEIERIEIDNYIAYIKKNHEREVMAGKMVCHDGDCGIYGCNVPVCTCGLLHKLLPFAASYPEEAIELYPKYEKDLEKQGVWEMLDQYVDEEDIKKLVEPFDSQIDYEELEKRFKERMEEI